MHEIKENTYILPSSIDEEKKIREKQQENRRKLQRNTTFPETAIFHTMLYKTQTNRNPDYARLLRPRTQGFRDYSRSRFPGLWAVAGQKIYIKRKPDVYGIMIQLVLKDCSLLIGPREFSGPSDATDTESFVLWSKLSGIGALCHGLCRKGSGENKNAARRHGETQRDGQIRYSEISLRTQAHGYDIAY